MKYNDQEIKKNTVIRFLKAKTGESNVGKVDYIRYGRYLRGDWGETEVDPLVDNITILRTYDGKLTSAGEAHNVANPHDRV